MASDVNIDNLGAPTLLATMTSMWGNTQLNAGEWAEIALQQAQTNAAALKQWQTEWLAAWVAAQAATAAAQVLLANNALQAAENAANQQYDLANRELSIAEAEYARFTEYFAPCENASVQEECARPEYTEPIEKEANRAAVETRVQFANAMQQMQRRRNRYCVGSMVAAERTFAIEQARAVAGAKEQVRRYLEDRQFQRQQTYFDRKMRVLSMGRNLPTEAISGINNAASIDSRGQEWALAARNQFLSAISRGIGNVIGAGVSAFVGPVPLQNSFLSSAGPLIGNSFSSVTSFGSVPGASTMFGPNYGMLAGIGSGSFNQ